MAQPGGDRRQMNALPRLMMLTALVLVLAFAVWSLYSRASTARGTVSAEELTRVVLIAAAPNEGGDVVAQIITIADVSGEEPVLEAVSPSLTVDVPGTSHRTLQYAYPFGGGAGVADALAIARGGDALPHVVVKADALPALISAAEGVIVRLPADMHVFDGQELYVLKAGTRRLSPPEFSALLKGMPYLAPADRAKLDEGLAEALVHLLAASPDGLSAQVRAGAIVTNLNEDALEKLEAAVVR